MDTVLRVRCRNRQESSHFQWVAESVGITWGLGIDMPWNMSREWLVIIKNPTTNVYYLRWTPEAEYLSISAPEVLGYDFTVEFWVQFCHTAAMTEDLAKRSTPTGLRPLATTQSTFMGVQLPQGFVATKFPGYFWNLDTKQLFTAKQGVLYPMKISNPNRWNQLDEPAYRVSHEGRRRNLVLSYLNTLTPTASTFPVEWQHRKRVKRC